GMTAGFIGSGGSSFAGELPVQRQATERRLNALRGFVGDFDASRIDRGLADSLNSSLRQLDELGNRRQAISALSLSQPDAVAYYSGTIAGLLALVDRIAILSSDAGIARQAGAYSGLLKAKEHAGIERALLTG
ncbi:nitrate- and nitrite sensing domain-containing protein, partial [Azoarcus taiwanensis]